MTLFSKFTKYWNAWVLFWSKKEKAHAIGCVRIGIGITLLYTFGSPWLADASTAIWVDEAYGGIRKYSLDSLPWFIQLFGGATPFAVNCMLGMGILSGILLIMGMWSQFAALLGMIAMNTVSWYNLLATGGHDDLIANALWLLIFVDSGTSFSLSTKIQTGQWRSNKEVYAFVRYLLIVQLIVMYASTGWQKLSAHWIPFGSMDALWYILLQPTWARYDLRWAYTWYPLTQMATLCTWLFETMSPLFLVMLYLENTPRTHSSLLGMLQRVVKKWHLRWVFIIFGALLHIGIMAFMVVGPFSLASLSYYPALLPKTVWKEDKDMP